MNNNEVAKDLNHCVMGKDFVDEDTDEYIYAS